MLLVFAFLIAACGSSANPKSADVKKAFAGLPGVSITDVTERDSTTIGRPNGPKEGFVVTDRRHPNAVVQVVIFDTPEMATERKKMLDDIDRQLAGTGYNIAHKNVLLIIPADFLPGEADEYRRALTKVP